MIRDETPGDATAIRALTEAAFAGAAHASGTEAAIVDALRAAGVLTLSLVLVEAGEPVGHVAFSPVLVDGADVGWFGLGPVSVRPDRQRRGLGAALVRDGLARLRAGAARGCVVLGDPTWYRRFGFEADAGLRLAGVDPRFFQRLAFETPIPRGIVTFHAAFGLTLSRRRPSRGPASGGR